MARLKIKGSLDIIIDEASITHVTPPKLEVKYEDYDVLPLPTDDGKLYLGNTRSASYKRYGPGDIHIDLGEKKLVGAGSSESHILGTCNQTDKAEDVCKIWVEEGRIAAAFQWQRK